MRRGTGEGQCRSFALRRARPDDQSRRLAIGDVPEVAGLRLNYRDRNLQRVDGMNLTIWNPYEDARPSVVRGIALGLPVTGDARRCFL